MNYRLISILSVILLAACSPTTHIRVTNLHDLASYQENSLLYALPRSRISVQVEMVHHHTVPGPYYAYAEKFLGIKGVLAFSKDEYEITNVSLSTFKEADPDYYYSLTSANPSPVISKLVSFYEEGLILDEQSFIAFSEYRSLEDDTPEPVHFTDLSVKKHIEVDEKGKDKHADGQVPIDLPVTKYKYSPKPLEQRAKEASDFLVKIRKRRFKLLAGQYDVFPEGQALETSVRELNALEQEYLSLFIGKTYSDTIHQTYYYTPSAGEELERNVICRFSEENGFIDAESTAGKPFVLELKSMEHTQALKQMQFSQTGPEYENVVFYRLPEKTKIRLFYGSTAIVEAEAGIYQYGPLVPFSVGLLGE